MRVAVFGASGTIGSALLPALSEHEVIAISRKPRRDEDHVRWRTADVSDAQSVAGVLEGVNVVYYLVHSLGASNYAARDRVAAQNVAAASEKAGVDQLIFLGGLGDEGGELSEHLRSRQETAATLGKGSVPVTTLRAGVVIGKGSAGFETIVALVDHLPVMVMPRWVQTETQPIAIKDAVAYLVGVCHNPATYGRSFDIGGPEVMTYGDMIARTATKRGKHPLLIKVPLLTPRLSSYWLHLVTPVSARVARPLIEGLRNPTIVKNRAIEEVVPLKLTPFDTAAETALAREHK